MSSQQAIYTNTVVLAIDGSEHAMAAVDFIQNLPIPETCKIIVLSVLIPRNAQYFATLERILDSIREKLQSKNRIVETKLLTGYPSEQIIEFCTVQHPSMLVLGAKGLRGTIRILLGGVAQQVVEYATCPVLIVRAPHTRVKNVLLATDGSEHSWYTIKHLDTCPLPSHSLITIMHVLPPEMTTEMLIRSWPYGIEALPPILSSEIDESLATRAQEEEKQGEALLEKTVNELSHLDISLKKVLRRGDAATEILNYAEENQIDLIIAGSRGLSQLQSWLLGSVSNKITHYANCSVLIVKKPV